MVDQPVEALVGEFEPVLTIIEALDEGVTRRLDSSKASSVVRGPR